jgi:riboflavin transport system substrate-binding protein
MSKKVLQVTVVALSVLVFAACSKGESDGSADQSKRDTYSIGVFVPGVVAGSPVYEQLVAGAKRGAADRPGTTVKVLEGGFNQSEWEEKLTAMAATREYDLLLTGNGAMPYIALPVAEAFPDQKFLIVDAAYESHPQMYTVLYNQVEQAYLVGYLAGLVTTSEMSGATPETKIGIIIGQEYPAMNEMIVPGYIQGAQEADAKATVDVRVIGNWYDANKAAELANSMMDAGVDAILTIGGSANQGVLTAAAERGRYVLYFDEDGYDRAPGTIVGCAELMQEKAVYEYVISAVDGSLEWGSTEILGVADGYVGFVDENPHYLSTVPEDIRAEMERVYATIREGEKEMKVPRYW